MNKLVLVTLLSYFLVTSAQIIGGGSGRINPGGTHKIAGVGGAAGAENWLFKWDGTAPNPLDALDAYKKGDTDSIYKAYEISGATADTVDTLGSMWFHGQNNNDHIRFENADDSLSTTKLDSLGTVKFDIFILGYTGGFAVSVVELTNSSVPSDNRIHVNIVSDGTVRAVHEGNAAAENITTTGTVSLETETTIRYTWDVDNENHSVKIGVSSWEDVNDPGMSQFDPSNDMNQMAIGEIGAGSTDDMNFYIKNVEFYPTWKNEE